MESCRASPGGLHTGPEGFFLPLPLAAISALMLASFFLCSSRKAVAALPADWSAPGGAEAGGALEGWEGVGRDVGDLPLAEAWLLSRLHEAVDAAIASQEKLAVGEAGRALSDFFWGDFADWYVEAAKPGLMSGEGSAARVAAQRTLRYATDPCHVLHPPPDLCTDLREGRALLLLPPLVCLIIPLRHIVRSAFPCIQHFAHILVGRPRHLV